MRNRRGRQSLGTALSIGALAGLLIWTKLRLVSDLPRSAYAVPNQLDLDGDETGAEGALDASRPEDSGDIGPEAISD